MTTSTLNVRVDLGDAIPASGDASLVAGAGLIVRVEQFLDDRGERPANPFRRNLSYMPGAPATDISVPSGHYGVSLLLPSGRQVSGQVDLRDRAAGTVTLEAGPSPREWLARQRLEGSVPAAAIKGAYPRRTGSGRFAAERGDGFEDFRSVANEDVANGTSKVSLVVDDGDDPADDLGAAIRRWTTLAETVESRRSPRDLGTRAGRKTDGSAVLAGSDWLFDKWRIEWNGRGRPFTIVRTGRSVELVSLPLPWMGEDVPFNAPIELLVDTSEAVTPGRTNVTVLDSGLYGMMSYLKSGSVSLAREALDQGVGSRVFEETLRGKFANPLPAAAAGYCLIASSDLAVRRDWFAWIANLDNRFEWLPDGAIAHGRLLSASERGTAVEARAAYLRGFTRGLPHFALGLGWLLSGLRRFRDDEARECAALVRRIALRADMGQAVTVLRFGRPPREVEDV